MRVELISNHVGMKAVCLSILCFGFLLPAQADVAPKGMTEFNKQCPAERLCPVLERSYRTCKSRKSKAPCREFVETMKKLSPVYDCQRSFDRTEKENYIVPALWVCGEAHREDRVSVVDEYLEFLSKLQTPEARRYFASETFRRVLDGGYAELYREPSEKLEAELNRKGMK